VDDLLKILGVEFKTKKNYPPYVEILENLGIAIGLILILAIGVLFAMLSVMFIFGLPQLYVNFLGKIGKRFEARFPILYKSQHFQGFIVIFLVASVSLILIGAIFLWTLFFEWLPR